MAVVVVSMSEIARRRTGMRTRRERSSWVIEASDQDREHAIAILRDELRRGVVNFNEFERRRDLILACRYLADMYSVAVMNVRRAPRHMRWQRRWSPRAVAHFTSRVNLVASITSLVLLLGVELSQVFVYVAGSIVMAALALNIFTWAVLSGRGLRRHT